MVEGGDTTPLKGHTILAIDPGFENARKSAVISLTCWYDPGTGGGGGNRHHLWKAIQYWLLTLASRMAVIKLSSHQQVGMILALWGGVHHL